MFAVRRFEYDPNGRAYYDLARLQISPDRGPLLPASPSIDEYSDLGGRDIGIGHHSRSQGLPVQFLIHSRAYRPRR